MVHFQSLQNSGGKVVFFVFLRGFHGTNGSKSTLVTFISVKGAVTSPSGTTQYETHVAGRRNLDVYVYLFSYRLRKLNSKRTETVSTTSE